MVRMRDRFDTGGLRAARYREKAAFMRRQAVSAVTQSLRAILLENAELYERLADTGDLIRNHKRSRP